MKRILLWFGFMAVLAVSTSPKLAAQAIYGSVVGSVTDSSGAAVTSAKVTVADIDKSVTNTATVNESGNYLQRSLIPGRYRIRVEAAGFKAFQQDATVSADTEIRVDAKLEVGQVSETVEVTAEAGLLKTERSDVATTYSATSISNLPIASRRFTVLQLYAPGNSVPTSGISFNAEVAGGQPFNTAQNGQTSIGMGYMLDGTDHRDSILGMMVFQPTLDSIAEAKVTTNAYDAEIGNAAAGVVSAQTKSGTNTMHGSLFWYTRNSANQARNPFTQSRINPATNRAIALSQWNQFGGSLGGAIQKNKLFYFADYQALRYNAGGSTLVRVPTAAERAGDLSALLPLGRTIFDPASGATPATRTQFSGNVIPAARLSSQARNLLTLIPLPNITATGEQPNYAGAGKTTDRQDQGNIRSDYFVSDKLHIFGRYSVANFRLNSPGVYGKAGGTGFDPSGSSTLFFGGIADNRHHNVAIGADYVVNPSLFTDFRVGWMRYFVIDLPHTGGVNGAQAAGIPGLNDPADQLTDDMPTFRINDYAGSLFKFGSGLLVSSSNVPLFQNEKQFQVVNNWTKVSGDHTLKFGADIRRVWNLRVASDRHRSGQLDFNGPRTQGPGGGGSGLATFLLGDVSFMERYVGGNLATDAREQQNRWFFFVQDTWKATRKLTLNYGLRWEIYRPQTVNKPGNGGGLDLNTGEVYTLGVGKYNLSGNQSDNFKLLAPRLGLAYQLNSKTVIRAGYGRGFSTGAFGSIFGFGRTQDLPVLANQALVAPTNFDAAFTLAGGPGPFLDPRTVLNGRPLGPNGLPILPAGQGMFVYKDRITLPIVDSWNFTIQRQLTGRSAIDISYVGNIGTRAILVSDYDVNQPSIVGFGTLTTNQRRPYFSKFGWNQPLRYFGNDATARYQALQIKFDKRFSQGLTVMSHFTFSKAINFNNVYYNQDARIAQGLNDGSRPKAFFMSANYELPFGKGRKFGSNWSKPLDLIAGGWQINGVWQWYSGLPFTPSYQNCGADQDVNICRPNIVGDFHASTQNQFGWFATCPSAMTSNGQTCGPWQRPQRGQLGNAGRNKFLFGPQFQQLDMSIFKSFALTERYRMQFRAEAFNAANHTNLANPNSCVDCAGTAGRIFGTFGGYSPRLFQFALRMDF